jgi:hypothetical protein
MRAIEHLDLQFGLPAQKGKLFSKPMCNILHMIGRYLAQLIEFKAMTFGPAPATKVAYH